MKPTSSFRLPKYTKMLLSNIRDPHLRGSMRRDYIKAILENGVNRSRSKEDRTRDKE